jgi:hypothetical protein
VYSSLDYWFFWFITQNLLRARVCLIVTISNIKKEKKKKGRKITS